MIQSVVGFLGRALISIIFILSAGQKILNWNDAEQFLHQALTDWMPVTLSSPSMQGGSIGLLRIQRLFFVWEFFLSS